MYLRLNTWFTLKAGGNAGSALPRPKERKLPTIKQECSFLPANSAREYEPITMRAR